MYMCFAGDIVLINMIQVYAPFGFRQRKRLDAMPLMLKINSEENHDIG